VSCVEFGVVLRYAIVLQWRCIWAPYSYMTSVSHAATARLDILRTSDVFDPPISGSIAVHLFRFVRGVPYQVLVYVPSFIGWRYAEGQPRQLSWNVGSWVCYVRLSPLRSTSLWRFGPFTMVVQVEDWT
jgi:hypothetical protein